MGYKRKILMVDDSEDICLTVKQYLELNNYHIEIANNGMKALEMIDNEFNLIILDIMMEGIDGVELCNIIREKIHCPIIFLSAKSLEEDKVMAFSVGGDDYITKPFSLRELTARIDSHIRREERKRIKKNTILSSKNIFIDLTANEVWCAGNKLQLTKKEYKVVELLIINKNVIFSKDKIFDKVWGIDSESYLETITESIKNIRKKIRLYDEENSYISTVYGLGYKWEIKNAKK